VGEVLIKREILRILSSERLTNLVHPICWPGTSTGKALQEFEYVIRYCMNSGSLAAFLAMKLTINVFGAVA
jgi:hypothetical protein